MRWAALLATAAAVVTGLAGTGPAGASGRGQGRGPNPALAALVPQAEGWTQDGERRTFFRDNLYEYIDGAAESYLSYDFQELLVLELKRAGSAATLTVEIYDMGRPLNAFGIFSAERYPENAAAAVGDLGYLEGESLNFMAGRYYVKLLSFGLGEGTGAALTAYARPVAGAVPDKGALPPLLRFFPKENLVARSEKYIRQNFMGYEFLHDGYVATYDINGREMECFLAESGSGEEAGGTLSRLLEAFAKDKQVPEKIALGYHVKNRYAQHLYISRVGNIICGVMRVPDGREAEGEKYLQRLTDLLTKAAGKGAAL